MNSFSIARLPRIEFGSGAFNKLPDLIGQYGRRVMLVTGASIFVTTQHWRRLLGALDRLNIEWEHVTISGEPSPVRIDEIVAEHRRNQIDVVVGIGGGSPMDAAKAIAGLLRLHHSVMEFLEGVGPERPYTGPSVPFIAVPTTAGTGSEATKNAVLSMQGKQGFKKSFRHDKLVAEYAVVDPELLATCPKELIAANGMDALTQLLESYVSLKSNPFTDALAISGMEAVRDSLLNWFDAGASASDAQAKMAYAALLSGITLAQVGLGSVHGLASPMGAFYPIPHGVVCGTLLAPATRKNIEAMLQRESCNPALDKYATLAELLCQRSFKTREAAWEELVSLLDQWSEHMQLPTLNQYGVGINDLDHVVANSRGSSMKTNPIVLEDDEIKSILLSRMSACG